MPRGSLYAVCGQLQANAQAIKGRSEWRGDKQFLVNEIRKSIDRLPGIEPTFTQPIEMRVSEMLTGSRGDLAVKIFGPDLATLSDLAGQVQKILSKTRGASEVMTVANDHVDYLQLDIIPTSVPIAYSWNSD